MGNIRVGILSMQRIYNYGSSLQAYALKKILEDLGCDVQFVDYEPGECLIQSSASKSGLNRKISKAFEVFKYKAPLKDRLSYIDYKRTYADKFYPLLELSDELNICPDIDLLIIGSDEVFNCVQDNANVGFTPTLFGYGIEAKRKITYAASFGSTTLDKLIDYEVDKDVTTWLSELNAISVRDENSRSIVSELIGTEPELHVDPVLAYDFADEFSQILGDVDKDDYIVVYGYSGRLCDEECQAIRRYADARSLKVLNIGGVQGCCDQFINCSPFEVLAYFKHAKAIVTDTFHGTIFASRMEVPFATFMREGLGGNKQKLTSLLKVLELTDREVASVKELETILETPIEWEATEKAIEIARERTYQYLRREIEACIQK